MKGYLVAILILLMLIVVVCIVRSIQYKKLSAEILQFLDLTNWKYRDYDDVIIQKTSKGVTNYTDIKYFKDNREKLEEAEKRLDKKIAYANTLSDFLRDNGFKGRPTYSKLAKELSTDLNTLYTYNISVRYTSPAGKSSNHRIIKIDRDFIKRLKSDPSLIMGKAEYNKFIKEQNQASLDKKVHAHYEMVNDIIDTANEYRDKLVIDGDQNELDKLISSLYDKTVNSIKKIKTIDSDEWSLIEKVISGIKKDVDAIVHRNKQILDYYNSSEFEKIKNTCNSLMETQKDFNEYINQKANSISALFGARVVRNETEVEDEYNYIRPYKKSITPFTAEVSTQVFASAENSPLDYVVKYFYPNKDAYPEQIQKLHLLVEELETLREAKGIIENYKKEYQQYLTDVPAFVMENDEDGFYSRLGFANISESVLTVEYKFSYTSNGGMAQRSFTVPMTEDTIVKLIEMLQSKLTFTAFAKEQRSLMTSKLRQKIKERDDFTCKYCGNSTHKEPNLLLEIDHILPVAKGGCTTEDNLQTLCWKCNRAKSDKVI